MGATAAPDLARMLTAGLCNAAAFLVLVKALHSLSDRHDKRLVAINCAAIPDNLIESELFGHEKGAFTGATQMRRGRFELAQGGTIFLDEIGEMGVNLQSKLLRVLQGREFERVGGMRTITVDVRVLAATNQDLQKAIWWITFSKNIPMWKSLVFVA